MIDWQKNTNEKLTEYLKTKYSENTKRYIYSIIEFLNRIGEDGLPLPVKSGDLQRAIVPDKIPYLGLYYRLLKELGEEGLIIKETGEKEPRKRGKKPTLYRLVVLHKMPSYLEIDDKIPNTSLCQSCYFLNIPDSKFCSECGLPLTKESATELLEKQPNLDNLIKLKKDYIKRLGLLTARREEYSKQLEDEQRRISDKLEKILERIEYYNIKE